MKKRRIEITRFRRRMTIVMRDGSQTGFTDESHSRGQAIQVRDSAAPPTKIHLDESQVTDASPRGFDLIKNRNPKDPKSN